MKSNIAKLLSTILIIASPSVLLAQDDSLANEFNNPNTTETLVQWKTPSFVRKAKKRKFKIFKLSGIAPVDSVLKILGPQAQRMMRRNSKKRPRQTINKDCVLRSRANKKTSKKLRVLKKGENLIIYKAKKYKDWMRVYDKAKKTKGYVQATCVRLPLVKTTIDPIKNPLPKKVPKTFPLALVNVTVAKDGSFELDLKIPSGTFTIPYTLTIADNTNQFLLTAKVRRSKMTLLGLPDFKDPKASPQDSIPNLVQWTQTEWALHPNPKYSKAILKGNTKPLSEVWIPLEEINPQKNQPTIAPENTILEQNKLPNGAQQLLKRDCVLRKNTSTKSKKLMILQRKKSYWMAKDKGRWYKVFAEQQIGYTSGSCLKKPLARQGKPPDLTPYTPVPLDIVLAKENPRTLADANGLFELILQLQHGLVELPVVIQTATGIKKTSQLTLKVTDKKVILVSPIAPPPVSVTTPPIKNKPQKIKIKTPIKTQHHLVAFGLGQNIFNYEQDIPSIGTTGSFQSSGFPSLFLQGVYGINRNWEMVFNYKRSPGSLSSNATTEIRNGEFFWTVTSIEGRKHPDRWRALTILKIPVTAYWTAGIQQHGIPFLQRETSSLYEIQDSPMTLVSGGAGVTIYPQRKLSYNFQMALQHPVASGDIFSVTGKITFDGSLGAVYRWTDSWQAGLYWYGQLHTFDFESVDGELNTNISGSQLLFYTNIEARLGYAF